MIRKHYRFTSVLFTLFLFSFTDVNTADESAFEILVVSAEQAVNLPERSEADYLAERLLMEESSELVLDPNGLQQLSGEIQSALNAVREFEPSMSSMTAREHFRSDMLIIDLQSDLGGKVKEIIEGQSGKVVFITGFKQFDELNIKLGLYAVEFYPYVDLFIFYFANPVNIPVALRQYAEIDGVEFAEPNVNLVEWTDIDAYRKNGGWIFVFKPPPDPDFSGKFGPETFYFSVKDGKVDGHWTD